MKTTECTKPSLQDIAAFVPQKCIINELTNKLSKEELIELLARKIDIKRGKQQDDGNDHEQRNTENTEKVKKWKLIQYGENDRIIENQEISTKMRHKIKKYLRLKNQMMNMEEKKEVKDEQETADGDEQLELDAKSENAEPSEELNQLQDE